VDTFECPHNAEGGVPCQRRSIDDIALSSSAMRWRDQYRLLGDQAFPGEGKKRDEDGS
jgi:hypothetical protein